MRQYLYFNKIIFLEYTIMVLYEHNCIHYSSYCDQSITNSTAMKHIQCYLFVIKTVRYRLIPLALYGYQYYGYEIEILFCSVDCCIINWDWNNAMMLDQWLGKNTLY